VTAPGVPFVVLASKRAQLPGIHDDHRRRSKIPISRSSIRTTRNKYLTPDGSQAFTTRDEEIAVRGGAPVQDHDPGKRRHGPVCPDLGGQTPMPPRRGTVLAVAHLAYAGRSLSRARFGSSTRPRIGMRFGVPSSSSLEPQQNMVSPTPRAISASSRPWRIPIRAKGDGYMPLARPGPMIYAWHGFIPLDQLANLQSAQRSLSPPTTRSCRASYPFSSAGIGTRPTGPYASINCLMRSRNSAPDDFAVIQADTLP